MGMVSAAIRSALKVGAGVAAGAVAFGATATTEDKSGALLQDIVDRVKRIERQLGVKTGGAKEEKYGAGFPYFPKGCTSLLSKHLTVDVYEQLKDKITPNGFTLERAIQSGVDNPDSGVGLYAGDEECYSVFGPLFDAVIEDYHGGYKPSDKHVSDLDAAKLKGNVAGKYFPLNGMSEADRKQLVADHFLFKKG